MFTQFIQVAALGEAHVVCLWSLGLNLCLHLIFSSGLGHSAHLQTRSASPPP